MRPLILMLIILFISTSTGLFAAKKINIEPQSWEKREHHYKSKDSFGTFEITYKGKIVVSENDKDITGISPNGYIKISKASFGNERIINIESDADGKLSRKYFEGKNEQDYEPSGKEWLADILIDVIRKTGISADQRVKRIYNKKGIEGVLDEIEEVGESGSSGNYVRIIGVYYENINISGNGNIRNIYTKSLVDNINLKKEDLALTFRAIINVHSNSTKGTL